MNRPRKVRVRLIEAVRKITNWASKVKYHRSRMNLIVPGIMDHMQCSAFFDLAQLTIEYASRN